MNNESKLTALLTRVAEDEPIDEMAAWEAITARISPRTARSHRARLFIGAGGLLAAGAAAAALALAGTSGNSQSVDVLPPVTESPAPTDVYAVERLAHSIAVVVDAGAAVEVWDVLTGENMVVGIEAAPPEVVAGATLGSKGTLFVTLAGQPDLRLLRQAWNTGWVEMDASVFTPFSAVGPAVSPDERLLAFGGLVSDDTTVGGHGVVLLYDVGLEEARVLEWPEGDPRAPLAQPQSLAFSADGTSVLFVNAKDNDGTEAFEAYEVSVDAADLGEARLVASDVWSVTYAANDDIVGIVNDRGDRRVTYLVGGPDVGLPTLDASAFSVEEAGGVLVAHTDRGIWRLDPERDQWVLTALPSS